MEKNFDMPQGSHESVQQGMIPNESFLMFMVGFVLFVFKLCKP